MISEGDYNCLSTYNDKQIKVTQKWDDSLLIYNNAKNQNAIIQ